MSKVNIVPSTDEQSQKVSDAVDRVLKALHEDSGVTIVNALVSTLNIALWLLEPDSVKMRMETLAAANTVLTAALTGTSPCPDTKGMTKQ